MWNLYAESYVKLLSGTFMANLFAKPLLYVEPFSGTLEPWNLYLWNLGTCKSGTFMGNLGETGPLCETWTFTSGTFMWKNPKLFKLLGKNVSELVLLAVGGFPVYPNITWHLSPMIITPF